MITQREIDLLHVLENIANMPEYKEGVTAFKDLEWRYARARLIADEAIQKHNETPTETNDALAGHVNEIGDIDALDGNPGLVIKCDRADLAAYGKNLIFADVLIYPK